MVRALDNQTWHRYKVFLARPDGPESYTLSVAEALRQAQSASVKSMELPHRSHSAVLAALGGWVIIGLEICGSTEIFEAPNIQL